MDLKTFLRPSALPLGARLEPGDVAPPLSDLDSVMPRMVVFLRHVGCPFAEATLLRMEELAERRADVLWIAVSHGTQDASLSWHQQIAAGRSVQLLVDTQRIQYAAWGLGTTSARHFLALRSLGGAVQLARRGIVNRHPSGSRWQSAGRFAVRGGDKGRIAACHYPEHAADMLDFDAHLQALAE